MNNILNLKYENAGGYACRFHFGLCGNDTVRSTLLTISLLQRLRKHLTIPLLLCHILVECITNHSPG